MSVKITSEARSEADIASRQRGETLEVFCDKAVRAAVAAHARDVRLQEGRDDWRFRNGTSVPKPMLTAGRPTSRVAAQPVAPASKAR
jgi:hypothetical protein